MVAPSAERGDMVAPSAERGDMVAPSAERGDILAVYLRNLKLFSGTH
jgi:hypothetical protein